MADETELVRLLRLFETTYEQTRGMPWIGTVRPEQAFKRAADTIEALQRERDRLRAAGWAAVGDVVENIPTCRRHGVQSRDCERAISLLLEPPDWLIEAMNRSFPSPSEIDGRDDEPFRRMVRAIVEAALNPPE